MRKFAGDKMPRRDHNGLRLRVINSGMQDPRIECGPLIFVSENTSDSQQSAEHTQTVPELQSRPEHIIDPVRAIHAIAAACGLESRAELA